ncbi:related to pisatin demethylase cytochrome P450 [Phialocephala subalpina]|uniref:Related to pisatin demethylase cytochrome P450 n=1 Tax=Phialocephala subalpina TaxID=576137 RepID=A0A1L7X9E5_9HELO|nr:related to pisatin demethylase cytochrome P450 [Phialocephala subalpina]
MNIVPDLPRWAALSAGSGVLSHLLYFIRGEHHKQVVKLAQLFFLIPTAIFILLIRVGKFNITEASLATFTLVASYLFSLWTSMLIYRAFFHRLGSFPGPPLAKLTKFWHIAQLGNNDNYKRLDIWHNQYGDYVRIGPSELSIVDPDAVEAIMGARSACTKAPWYDGGDPLVSMHQCRDRVLHDKRRRVWDRGFSMKALDSYESRVKDFANILVEQIKSFSGKPLNASLWFNYYSFDVMGELAFGRSFDMLKTGEKHYAIELLAEGTRPIGVYSLMPWLVILFTKIPGLSSAYQKWISFCEDQAEKRKQMEVKERDIMSWLLEAEPMSADPFKDHMWLVGDSRLIIVAGSDTTAATLTHLFYHIARDPAYADRLREELKPIMQPDGDFDIKDLGNADYLNGMINETLRLHPPVPSGLSRLTPPEGITIGETRVPGDTIVAVPLWSMGRSPKAWAQPNDFIPERWYSKPELIHHKNAFAPFSIGRYGCIGKNLALMELRTVTALLITKFNVSFAPGENGSNLLEKSEDYFTIGLADLNLQFTPRK